MGVLADGHKCPRCKGHKVQLAFSSPCAKCAGTGSLTVPCKRCGGNLKFQADCPACEGTGCFRRK
jgi:DnaJ-class molecular chaperone